MVIDGSNTDKNIRELERRSKEGRRRSSKRSSSSRHTSRQQRRRSEPSSSRLRGHGHHSWKRSRTADGLSLNPDLSGPSATVGSFTTQEGFDSPRTRSRRTSHGRSGVQAFPSRSSRSFREVQIKESAFYSSARSSRSVREERKTEVAYAGPQSSPTRREDPITVVSYAPSRPSRSLQEEQKSTLANLNSARRNSERTLQVQETIKSGNDNKRKNRRHKKKINPEKVQTTENVWRKPKVAPTLCCMIVGLIVGGVVAYFVFLANTEQSESESMGTLGEEPTLSPSTRATSPPTLPPSSLPPSSSPTLPFLYDPPLIEDCNQVRSGDMVLGQDLMTERNFDIVLDVTMDFQVGITETMELLELEIQKLLMPKLVGCDEAHNRKLRHDRRILRTPTGTLLVAAR